MRGEMKLEFSNSSEIAKREEHEYKRVRASRLADGPVDY